MADLKYKRVLLKLSGEALGGGEVLNFTAVEHIAEKISLLVGQGVEVGVVCGGGNIWRGRSSGDMDRNRADYMGMLATVINSLAVADALEKQNTKAEVFSAIPMNKICEEFTPRAANGALAAGKVAIFAAGSGSPFFTTDTAAALRAAEIHADALLLAKNVDAVYSADPKTHPDAERYQHLSYDEVIAHELKATDLTAITLCKENRIPILVFALAEDAALLGVVRGENPGTTID